MYRSLYTKRSQILGVWIAISFLALIVVVSSVSFDTIKVAFATEDLTVKVDVDDDEIERGNTQKIQVTVTKDGNSNDDIAGADVKLTVYPPETESTTANDETDDDGKANFDVKISDGAEYGTYEVKVKVSKDGFNTNTEDSSFEVTGSGSDDNDDTKDDGGHESGNSGNDNDDDDKGEDDSDDKESNGGQALSQGNTCGNGFLSANILCQNVANQLQGDGNAINIITVQNGGGENDGNVEDSVSGTSLESSSASSVPPSQYGIQRPHAPISGLTNDYDSTESIIDQYVQARLNHAIETRLNHLK